MMLNLRAAAIAGLLIAFAFVPAALAGLLIAFAFVPAALAQKEGAGNTLSTARPACRSTRKRPWLPSAR
jgi:hypothetical protein